MHCKAFIDREGASSIDSALKILSSMSSVANCDENVRTSVEPMLINSLSSQAQRLQQTGHSNNEEIVKLLLGLTKLRPDVVANILQQLENRGVTFADSVWCGETPADWCAMVTSDSVASANACSIMLFLAAGLERSLHQGEVQVDQVHPKKLVFLLTPFFLKHSRTSKSNIKECMSTKLVYLDAEDMLNLSPDVIMELFSPALESALASREELQRLAQLIDAYLLLGAQKNLWTREFKETFKRVAQCVPSNVRERHDVLYDAVVRFAGSIPREEALDLWPLVDVQRVSETTVETAVESLIPHCPEFLGAMLQKYQDMFKNLKRKLAHVSHILDIFLVCPCQFAVHSNECCWTGMYR